MNKKPYVTPELIVFGDIQAITRDPGDNGLALGLSCGNGNVNGPIDCGHNDQGHEDNGNGVGQH